MATITHAYKMKMKNDFDPEVDNPENYKFTIFYFNPKDKRVIVPKRNIYLGWTLNLGNINAYLLLGSVILVLLLTKLFL